ncbi:FbpB family small basic protein [Parageobacillus thermoglucosidasius]|nr:FbpB family small basic protein [Parageobacillus thermoglucosidasius]
MRGNRKNFLELIEYNKQELMKDREFLEKIEERIELSILNTEKEKDREEG